MTKQTEAVEILWNAYREARLKHEAAQEAEKIASERRRGCEEDLIEGMLAVGMRAAEINGRAFSLRRQVNISVTKDNEDDVRGWLAIELGQDAAQDYLEVKVKRFAVERMVKEGLREGKDPESYPKFLKLYDRPRISVRGWDNDEDAPKPKQER